MMVSSLLPAYRASELKTMEWDDYEYLLKKVREEISKQPKEDTNG
jgi:hypothetical protein